MPVRSMRTPHACGTAREDSPTRCRLSVGSAWAPRTSSLWGLAGVLAICASSGRGWAQCLSGAYADTAGNVIVLTEKARLAKPHLGYLTSRGRFGTTKDPRKPFTCKGNSLRAAPSTLGPALFARVALARTDTAFSSVNTRLVGQLTERMDSLHSDQPLLVLVHGSEKQAAIGSARSLLFAAMGIRVFSYDKRGTGRSEGLYTQNFELLAEDAAAALRSARALAEGRSRISGFYGASQGGWVAPLAAIGGKADFVAVGYGLLASPIEEDLDQMLLEASAQRLGREARGHIRKLSQATARLVTSHFLRGFKQLQKVRESTSQLAWSSSIQGEYSGDMLRMSSQDLRRIGRAAFDNVELIWDYESMPVLRQIRVPLLWVLAEHDREAPMRRTMARLLALKKSQVPIEGFVFPRTDHGMYEYVQEANGRRKMTRIAEGYFALVASWVKGAATPPARGRYLPLKEYARAQR